MQITKKRKDGEDGNEGLSTSKLAKKKAPTSDGLSDDLEGLLSEAEAEEARLKEEEEQRQREKEEEKSRRRTGGCGCW